MPNEWKEPFEWAWDCLRPILCSAAAAAVAGPATNDLLPRRDIFLCTILSDRVCLVREEKRRAGFTSFASQQAAFVLTSLDHSYRLTQTHSRTQNERHLYFSYAIAETLSPAVVVFVDSLLAHPSSSNSSESQPKGICFTQHRKPASQTPTRHRRTYKFVSEEKLNNKFSYVSSSFFSLSSSSCELLLSSTFFVECAKIPFRCWKLTSRGI